ncbi:hypothetical protein GCM10018954_084880 [Kutzneria kofuensis]
MGVAFERDGAHPGEVPEQLRTGLRAAVGDAQVGFVPQHLSQRVDLVGREPLPHKPSLELTDR